MMQYSISATVARYLRSLAFPTWYSGNNVNPCYCFFATQEQLPDLHIHFQAQSFHTSMYASSWFLTIFLTSFPLPVATRIFDIFMCEVRLTKIVAGATTHILL